MLVKDIADQLRVHSGLTVAGATFAGPTYFDSLQALKKEEAKTGLEDAVRDVVDCFQRLNSFNQSTPEARREILHVDIVYAVAGMMQSTFEVALALLQAGRNIKDLLNVGWKVSCGWDALLAGDIEDIKKHLDYEMVARIY